MSTSTRFTELVGCELPIQLAAMGGVGTTELAAAVAGAGGLGMVPSGAKPAAGACGINFLMPFDPTLEEIEDASGRCRVLEFFYGDPRPDVIEITHRGGALAGWQVGSAAEAAAAEASGCDYVVIQGTKAGGHVRATQPLEQVLPETLAAVRVPVVAAGGVATPLRFAEVSAWARMECESAPDSSSPPSPVRIPSMCASSSPPPRRHTTDRVVQRRVGGRPASRPPIGARCCSTERLAGAHPSVSCVDRGAIDMAMYAGTGVGDVTAADPAAAVVVDLVRLL